MKTIIKRLLQAIDSSLIIVILSPLLLFLSFKPIDADKVPGTPQTRREFKMDSTFQSIRIDGDISVVLTNDPAGTVIMEGKAKQLNKVSALVNNHTLVIDVNRMNLFAKVRLYLSARSLRRMQLNGNADITSVEFIKSDHLHIFLNGNITVKLKTMGWVSLDSPDDIDLVWKSSLMKKRNHNISPMPAGS